MWNHIIFAIKETFFFQCKNMTAMLDFRPYKHCKTIHLTTKAIFEINSLLLLYIIIYTYVIDLQWGDLEPKALPFLDLRFLVTLLLTLGRPSYLL